MLEPIKQTRAAGVPARAADEPGDLTARAINAEPLPGMVKLRCDDCRFWFAAPRTGVPRCPDCAIRRERLARRAAWGRPKPT